MDEHKFVNVSPSQPQYFGFVMPEGLESVVLNVRSNDKKCMVVSVQDTKVRSSMYCLRGAAIHKESLWVRSNS